MLASNHLTGFSIANNIAPSTTSITATGSQNFLVPEYNVLIIDLWGAGASGAGNTPGAANFAGLAGGDTTISSLSLIAGGSPGGAVALTPTAGGTAAGGDTNTSGNQATGGGAVAGVGGNAPGPGGGAGGAGAVSAGAPNGSAGSAPGAGGGGSYNNGSGTPCYVGGSSGAYLRKTYVPGAPGAPVPNTTLSVNIGVGGAVNPSGTVKGGIGANGKATFTVT